MDMKTILTMRNMIGTVGLLAGAYLFLKVLPDVQRYVRISRM